MRNKRITIILLVFILFLPLIFAKNSIYAQRSVSHNLGKIVINLTYNHDWDDQNQNDGIIYPNGYYQRQLSQYWRTAMVARNWIAYEGATPEEETETIGPYYGISMTEYRKYAPPTVKVDGTDITEPWTGTVDNSIHSDVYADWKFKTLGEIGIEVNHKTYSFVNQNHDDYVIFDLTMKFTGDIDEVMGQDVPNQTIDFAWAQFLDANPTLRAENLVYTGLWRPGSMGWATWDHYTEYAGKPLTTTGKPRDDLIISYIYSGDDRRVITPVGHTESGTPPYFNNQGCPDPLTGHLLAAQSVGMTTFHVDKSAGVEDDDPENMPTNVAWMYHTDMTGVNWPHGFWGFLTDTEPDFDRKEHFIEYNHDDNDWNTVSGNFLMKHGYGPYQLSIGDNVRAVFAIGAGMISEDRAFSEGVKWYNWYWDKPGAKLDDAGKEALIWEGVDALFVNLDNAYWAYHNGYNVPDPPPSPDIEVDGQAGRIEIKWSYPEAGMDADVDGWRLYRKLGAFVVDHEDDGGNYYPYELIKTFDSNITSYYDEAVTMGNKYHYCVTAVDDQGLESSYYANRTSVPSSSTKLGLDTSEEVLVVPNPYSISTGVLNELNWPGYPDEIRFVNLPVFCTLKIYTATGELIKTIEHDDRSIDEAWEGLRTDSNQYPASGVYILVVDNAKDDDNSPLPKQIYKFVIVR